MYPGNPRKLLKEQTLALSFLQRLGTFLSHHTLLFFPNTCCIPAAREMNPSHGQWKCELIEPHWRAAWWYLLNCNHTHSMAQRVYLHTTQHLPTGTLIHAHEESCPREANTASLINSRQLQENFMFTNSESMFRLSNSLSHFVYNGFIFVSLTDFQNTVFSWTKASNRTKYRYNLRAF